MRKTAAHDRLACVFKAAREAKGYGQREMAAKLGTSQTTVSLVENGTQSVTVCDFLLWCDALGLNPEETLRSVRSE